MIHRLLRFFMSDNPPDIHCLFPRSSHETGASYWSSSILGRHFQAASLSSLTHLRHCKARKSPKHEFLIVDFMVNINEHIYNMSMIIDRCPAIEVESNQGNAPPAACDTISSSSQFPSTSSQSVKAASIIGGKVSTSDHAETAEPSSKERNLTPTASLTSPLSSVSPFASPSPSSSVEHLKATLGIGGKVPAADRVIIPKFG